MTSPANSSPRYKDKKSEQLEAKLQRKNEVLAELMEETGAPGCGCNPP
jgi:hypothetical protein